MEELRQLQEQNYRNNDSGLVGQGRLPVIDGAADDYSGDQMMGQAQYRIDKIRRGPQATGAGYG